MIFSGELPTPTAATLYAAPLPQPGIPNSGNNVEINLFRIVNESGAARTFTVYLNKDGTDRAITPVDTELGDGSAWDDVPVFQLPPGAKIKAVADGDDVSWTINATIL